MPPFARLVLLSLAGLAPASGALALDYRIAAETNAGLGLIDADSVEVVGTTRRLQLTVIFPEQDGSPAEIGVASVIVDCKAPRYRIESMIGYDRELKEIYRQSQGDGWSEADEGTPFYPASDFVCRGKTLPSAESQDLKAVVDSYLRRAAGEQTI